MSLDFYNYQDPCGGTRAGEYLLQGHLSIDRLDRILDLLSGV